MRTSLLPPVEKQVYSTKQLFRSSPFFQAIERAYADPTKVGFKGE
jgi:hypothetical protein